VAVRTNQGGRVSFSWADEKRAPFSCDRRLEDRRCKHFKKHDGGGEKAFAMAKRSDGIMKRNQPRTELFYDGARGAKPVHLANCGG